MNFRKLELELEFYNMSIVLVAMELEIRNEYPTNPLKVKCY